MTAKPVRPATETKPRRSRAQAALVFGAQDGDLRRYAHGLGRWRAHNRIELLRAGGETFPAMLAAIAAATRSIQLESYIILDDLHGRRFIDALCERARAGVVVRLMFDAIGSWGLSLAAKAQMSDAGIQWIEYRPIAPWRAPLGLMHRNHRKILVVDDSIGFVGGLNLTSQYAAKEDDGEGWLDYSTCFEGPIVRDCAKIFRATWLKEGGDHYPLARAVATPDAAALHSQDPGNPVARSVRTMLARLRWLGRPQKHAAHNEETSEEAINEAHNAALLQRNDASNIGVIAQALHNEVRAKRLEFQRAYLHAIHRAKSFVTIENAYFLPNRAFRKAMYRAVDRGVVVSAIVPANSDVKAVEYAGRYLHRRLVKAGVRVYYWAEPMLHSKIAVVDGVWSTVGSYNIDSASLNYNLEISIAVLDAPFGELVRQAIDADIAKTTPYNELVWQAMPWWKKLLCWGAFRLRRWL